MGRHKLPSAILAARGSFKRNPQRKRDSEAVGEPLELTDIEALLGENGSEAVLEVAARFIQNAPVGMLQRQDAAHLSQLCCLWVEFIECPQDFKTSRHALLNRLLGLLGFNPSQRSNVAIPKPLNKNRFAD